MSERDGERERKRERERERERENEIVSARERWRESPFSTGEIFTLVNADTTEQRRR